MNRFITFTLLFIVAFSHWACQPTAQSIIDDTITTHGGAAYKSLTVEFDFREMHYILKTDGGEYRYERQQTDSSGVKTVDVLTNSSFSRAVDNEVITLADSMIAKYSNSVNSVAYFFLLPASLNDASVNKKRLNDTKIKGENYYQIEVTFAQEGGGTDYQDRYIYWINQTTKTLDYLAYSYETNGGGVRFREAYNINIQNGIRFCDYRNYGLENLKTPLEELPTLFEKGELPLLSTIENTNVLVKTKP